MKTGQVVKFPSDFMSREDVQRLVNVLTAMSEIVETHKTVRTDTRLPLIRLRQRLLELAEHIS